MTASQFACNPARARHTGAVVFVCALGLVLSGCASLTHEEDYISQVVAEALGSDVKPSRTSKGLSAEELLAELEGQRPTEIPEAMVAVPVPPEQPAPVKTPQPARVEAPTPTSVKTPQPVQVETPRPTSVETPQPVQVETPRPTSVETPQPVQVETPKPAPVETPQPVQVETPRPPAPPPPRQLQIKPSVPRIQPDTVLWITVAEDPSLNGRYTVNNGSCIDLGYVGLVFLYDMTVEEAEAALKNILEGRYLTRATASVRIAKASYDFVAIRGLVETPGDMKIGPGTAVTLHEALRRANGLRLGAQDLRVKIVRGGMLNPFGPAAEGETYPLILPDGRLKVPEIYLRNNDLVYVFAYEAPRVGGNKRIIMLGEVARRGVVDFSPNEPCTLMYLLFKVGGLPRFAKANKVKIVRRDAQGHETTIVADAEALLKEGNPDDDVTLENGDRVIVPARKITFF